MSEFDNKINISLYTVLKVTKRTNTLIINNISLRRQKEIEYELLVFHNIDNMVDISIVDISRNSLLFRCMGLTNKRSNNNS